jgi:hypothetical protein
LTFLITVHYYGGFSVLLIELSAMDAVRDGVLFAVPDAPSEHPEQQDSE